MPKLASTIAVLSIFTASLALQAQAQPTAADLAKRLQARYQTINSFTADFSSEFRTKLLPQVERSSGTVKVLKPNMMWWKYEKPWKKDVVVDGKTMWDHDGPNKIAYRSTLPPQNDGNAGLMFLAGRGDLIRDFNTAMAATQPPGEWHLELTPKSQTADFTSLTLMVSRDDLKLIGLKMVDSQDAITSHRFTNLRENVKLVPADFVFRPPAGVQVEHR